MEWKIKSGFFLSLQVTAIVLFVVLVSLLSGSNQPGRSDAELDKQWQQFSKLYGVTEFGNDGYFVRAIRHGHGLFYRTWDFAWRFTRKTSQSAINSCSSCHSPEEMAFSFVNSDRYDAKLGQRVSFEERIMRCYVDKLDGFVPTIYDPAIRDIRIFSRMVAHALRVTEGDLNLKLHDRRK